MSSRVGVACLLALPVFLGAAGCTRQSDAPVQANAVSPDEAPATAAARAGVVDRSHRGEAMPAATLIGLDGKPATLGARPVLVNLWATWCAPCVAELPALDTAVAGRQAVALNQGEDAAKVRAFLAGKAVRHLRPLLDRDMAVSLKLNANLPTTILYDAAGKELWRVTGARDWASVESKALIAEAT